MVVERWTPTAYGDLNVARLGGWSSALRLKTITSLSNFGCSTRLRRNMWGSDAGIVKSCVKMQTHGGMEMKVVVVVMCVMCVFPIYSERPV